MFTFYFHEKSHPLTSWACEKNNPACCHMKAKKTIEVFAPHETRATPPNISFFWNGKRDTGDTGKRDTQDRGHTEHNGTQGTQGTQGIQGTRDTRDRGHKGHREHKGHKTHRGHKGTQGNLVPRALFPPLPAQKNGKKKPGSIGQCFTLCIFTFCLHLCLAKDNERLWHYHRIWKRFLCG